MAQRQIYYAESNGTSSVASTSYTDKTTLTFTPDASSDYFLFWCATMLCNTTTNDFLARLRNTTSSTNLCTLNVEPKDATARHMVGGSAKETFGGSPASQTYKIQYACEVGTDTTEIRDARILAIKKDSLDQYAESTGSSTTTSSTLQDKATLTFTPGSQGDYLIIATAEMGMNSTTQIWEAVLDVDGSSYGNQQHSPKDTALIRPWIAIKRVNLTAASHTIKIRYRSVNGTGTASIRNARIIALRCSAFENNYYAEQTTRQTSTLLLPDESTGLSLSYSPQGVEHIAFACAQMDSNTSTDDVLAEVRDIPPFIVEAHAEPIFAPTIPYPFFVAAVRNYTASARTAKFQAKQTQISSASNDTIGIDEMVICALEKGSRSIQSSESLAESTTTSSTMQDKVSLTFTPDALATYVLFWSALLAQAGTGSANALQCRLYDGVTVLSNPSFEVKDTLDYHHQGGVALATFGALPVSQTYKIQYAAGASTTKIKDARIVALKLGSNDQSAASDTESTTTSTSYQDKTTLTFTPATTGDYLLIWSADVAETVNNTGTVKLLVDGADYCVTGYAQRNTADYATVSGSVKVNLSNSSKTIKIQYKVDSSGTFKIKNARIIALRLSDFNAAHYAEQRTRQTYGAVGDYRYNDALTNTFTPAAGDHLFIATAIFDYSVATRQGYVRLLDGAYYAPQASNEETNNSVNGLQVFSFSKFTPPASETTGIGIFFNSDVNTATVGIDELAIAVLQTGAGDATLLSDDAAHALSSDTATFSQEHVLLIGDAAHVLSSDTATFAQAHILTLADAAHVLSSDTATFAQQHILSILDAAMAHEAENATFSQVHTLALADAAHVHAAENVTFTQVHDLTVGDAQHAHAADEVTLGVDLPVDDAAHAHTADTVTFAQVHAFTVGNAAHVVESEEATFTQAHTYIVSDAESAHTADNATFTQNHAFVSDDAAHVHTADSVTFAQVHSVAISDAPHVLSSDAATFSQIHDVSVDDGTSPHTAENVGFVENYTLNSTDSAHTLSSDTATFTQNHVFVPLSAEHVLDSDEASLSSEIILMIDDALQAHEAENVTFTQLHAFSPDSAAHALTSDTATFAQIHILQIQDATQTHTGEEVTFTQNHVVVVADAAHQQTADNATISQVHAFMVASAVHAMESEQASFSQTHVIDVADSAIALASDSATFTQVHALQVDDALHVFFGEEASIEATGFFVLDGRRIVYVPAHDGTVAGELAGRVVAAARNARLQESPASVRIVKISNTNRTT